jgi:hypothetical protein
MQVWTLIGEGTILAIRNFDVGSVQSDAGVGGDFRTSSSDSGES